jgi:hypothetical protein
MDRAASAPAHPIAMTAVRRTLAPFLLLLLCSVAGCGETSHVLTQDDATVTAGPKAKATAEPATRASHRQRRKARAAQSGGAAAALRALPVKGRAAKTGYDRTQFGDGWASIDGCDARDRMLARDLSDRTYLDDCRVESGTLDDPYTATRITFERGGASEVDIDHVVALGDAWQKGAQQLSQARRAGLANDALNLLSVDASANRAKGDGDAATWLPPNKRFRCDYVARQVAVKTKYHLWVTRAEHDAIARVLSRCPGQRLPASGRKRVHVVPIHVDPAPTSTPKPRKREQVTASAGGRRYANCDAARAAGAAPIMRDTADYGANTGLDRDHDGIACE